MSSATDSMTNIEQNERITEVVARESARLTAFLRRRLPVGVDAEDVLQEVFYELVRANRLAMPIEYVTAWLYRVAQNRVTDVFRKKRPEALSAELENEEGEMLRLEDLLPSEDAGPEELYLRTLLQEELERAIGELPAAQREVFLAHEVEGRSFKEMAEEAGVGINTLLARKRYAVLALREKLEAVYVEFSEG